MDGTRAGSSASSRPAGCGLALLLALSRPVATGNSRLDSIGQATVSSKKR
jgi:hypothetical protein